MDGIRVWNHGPAYNAGIAAAGLGRGDMFPLSKMAVNIGKSDYPVMSFRSGSRHCFTELSDALSFP